MISMEITMNLTDYLLTGGAILTWWVIPIMLLVGFLTHGLTIIGDLKIWYCVPLKNWDNKTWLSSKKYIQSFNNFLLKQVKLNRDLKF